MRIYTAADIHGRRKRLALVTRMVEELGPDCVVAAGDLCARFGRDPAAVLASLDRLGVPVLVVRGNSDPRDLAGLTAGARNVIALGGRSKEVCGGRFAGLDGTVPLPFSNRAAWREKAALHAVSGLLSPQTALVAHCPPQGAGDRVAGRFSSGSRGLARLLAAKSPALLLCGHVHEDPGVWPLGDTLVVNCALGPRCAGALVDWNPPAPPSARILPGPGAGPD
ncbi:MAG: metallophosphoesterase family protein [Deltaproteobacteria bacterium]|nr:metallophosphoesterase family protein [Deltaproteobacteria bacterium]